LLTSENGKEYKKSPRPLPREILFIKIKTTKENFQTRQIIFFEMICLGTYWYIEEGFPNGS
jgi:hypothetical protein